MTQAKREADKNLINGVPAYTSLETWSWKSLGSGDFDYVVKEQEKSRIAFGTGQERTLQPLAGLRGGASKNALLNLRATDLLYDVGPANYHSEKESAFYKVLSRVTSTKGVGTGARLAPRFKETIHHYPAPNTYTIGPGPCAAKTTRPNKAPFNSSARRDCFRVSSWPGPGTYMRDTLSKRGTPVEVRCGRGKGPGPCEGCGQEPPGGSEFWMRDHRTAVLCQDCMFNMLRKKGKANAKFSPWQLQTFKKTRDCSDIHRHEGTTAKIFLVEPSAVKKKRQREAYLSRFFKDLTVIDKDFCYSALPAKLDEDILDELKRSPSTDDYCCLHEGLNSFNRDRMSFGFGSQNISLSNHSNNVINYLQKNRIESLSLI